MYGWDTLVLLKHLLEQDLPKTAIAERLGVSRRSVYHWIKTGQLERDLAAPPPSRVRSGGPTKLDPYKPIIDTRLADYPELSAVRLFAECQAAGYTGSLTQLKVYVREVRPRPGPEPVVRFETAPGHQAQFDFATVRFPFGRRYALMVVLGYSRLLYVKFVPRQTMQTVMRGLEDAFAYFGGVPREVLFDQMKAVVLEDERPGGGRLLENPEFARFAAHWGFRIRACRPYRAQTKGKVERPVRYLRESFVYGREILGDGDLADESRRWLDEVANRRVHATTREVPWERFRRDELPLLQPVAHRPYRSLVLAPEREQARTLSSTSERDTTAYKAVGRSSTPGDTPGTPSIAIERRDLAAYTVLVEGLAS